MIPASARTDWPTTKQRFCARSTPILSLSCGGDASDVEEVDPLIDTSRPAGDRACCKCQRHPNASVEASSECMLSDVLGLQTDELM
mmetsp:Transcript_6130/g.7609  ORF Transcript_6130/g.7609 Transcript_6130/m.7609 type:complete len:86 (+) Transcript_6130:411-668(+)